MQMAHVCSKNTVLEPGELCDDANYVNEDACTNSCLPAVCTDGFLAPGEVCDDGDSSNENYCSRFPTAS